MSDGILERYWTKPKKTKRELIELRNPPKESMSKVGSCNIIIGPHIFDAMLYTVKDPKAQTPYPPQRQVIGSSSHGSTFQQYQPYPPPSQPLPQAKLQLSAVHTAPTAAAATPPIPSSSLPAAAPRPPNNSAHSSLSSALAHSPPAARAPASAPQPTQSVQGPYIAQSSQPAKPSPDPVIQMLATRAASDPELKALMRVVASSKASQEQLRTFQGHIDELNAIIKAREQQRNQEQQRPQAPQPRQREPPSKAQPPSQSKASAPGPPGSTDIQRMKEGQGTSVACVSDAAPVNSNIASDAPSTPGVASSGAGHPVQPSRNLNHSQQQPTAWQGPKFAEPAPIQSRPSQHGPPTNGPYYCPGAAAAPPPPKVNYKSVVFEFTSPLTPYGSSTSGHAGSGDRYLFPEYSILEWQGGGNVVVASFLLVRKVDPSAPFPIEVTSETSGAVAKNKAAYKSKKGKKDKGKDGIAEKDNDSKVKVGPKNSGVIASSASIPSQQTATGEESSKASETGKENKAAVVGVSTPMTASTPESRDSGKGTAKESNEKNATEKEQDMLSDLKEYYQPVTMRIVSASAKVLEPLARVVKPPDQVRKYMNEIMDRVERAPEGFLAFRLPRGGSGHSAEDTAAEGSKKGGIPASSTFQSSNTPQAARISRTSMQKLADADSDSAIENYPNSALYVELAADHGEEELKDHYGPPTSIPPWDL